MRAAAGQGDNAALQSRVNDAAAMLTDKDTLEGTVRRQGAALEKAEREMRVARAALDAKDASIAKAE